MSNYLNQGRRDAAKTSIKRAEAAMEKFNKALYNMNVVYHALKEDKVLTEDNFEDKVKAISDFEFTENHINMLKSDLLKSD